MPGLMNSQLQDIRTANRMDRARVVPALRLLAWEHPLWQLEHDWGRKLSGLPPACISVGDIDLFYEENRHYSDRLKQHGVAIAFDVVHGAPHGFDEIARRSAMAKAFLARSRDWLGEAAPQPVGHNLGWAYTHPDGCQHARTQSVPARHVILRRPLGREP